MPSNAIQRNRSINVRCLKKFDILLLFYVYKTRTNVARNIFFLIFHYKCVKKFCIHSVWDICKDL